MPDENDGKEIQGDPNGEPMGTPPPPTKPNTEQNGTETENLEKGLQKEGSWLVRIGFASLVMNAIIAYIYMGQLNQMKVATQASARSAEIAAESLTTDTLQIDREMTQTVNQTVAQFQSAQATIKAANAAKSAADTAKETLLVSERAYIYIGTPDVDFVTRQLTVPLVNGGHIPSGPVNILVYEVTLGPLFPGLNILQGRTAEKHWRSAHLKSITTSPSVNYAINIPKLDQAMFNDGQQGFAVAGEISYNDGFPHTPLEIRQFCFLTRRGDKADSLRLIECDPDIVLPKIKAIVEYPANEESNQQ